MIIFIDESGDAGFKIQKGSSKYFTVVLVIFVNESDAEETALNIKNYKKKLKKSDNFEFKFSKSNKEFRLKLLTEMSKYNFTVRAAIFEKDSIKSANLRKSENSFYNYAIKSALERNRKWIHNARIKIDGRGSKIFKRNLKAYLRKELNSKKYKVIDKLQFIESDKDVLIQLADMVAGSINKSYESDKPDSKEYIKIIKKKLNVELISTEHLS